MLAVYNENNNIPSVITDITKAIVIKFKVIGIKPEENSIPAAIPVIMLKDMPIISQTVKPSLLYLQSIRIPPI